MPAGSGVVYCLQYYLPPILSQPSTNVDQPPNNLQSPVANLRPTVANLRPTVGQPSSNRGPLIRAHRRVASGRRLLVSAAINVSRTCTERIEASLGLESFNGPGTVCSGLWCALVWAGVGGCGLVYGGWCGLVWAGVGCGDYYRMPNQQQQDVCASYKRGHGLITQSNTQSISIKTFRSAPPMRSRRTQTD